MEKTNELLGADDPRFGNNTYDNSHVPTDPRVWRAAQRRRAQRVTVVMPTWVAVVCIAVVIAFIVFAVSAFLIRTAQ